MNGELAAHQIYTKLRGIFAVYKNEHVSISSLSSKILNKIVEDLNTNFERKQKKMVRFLPNERQPDVFQHQQSSDIQAMHSRSVIHKLEVADRIPVNVPDMFDLLEVQGPRYEVDHFELCTNHALDVTSSGIQLFGLQTTGISLIKQLFHMKLPRSYHLRGRFGLATTRFDTDSRVIAKFAWDHITKAKVETILGMLQGSHRNALLKSSGLDLESQLAYEILSKGLLKPERASGPIILSMTLQELNLPHFVLDVTCLNESCQYLRQVVDEVGSALRSSAVCTSVHRYRDGTFYATDDSTFLSRDIKVEKVIETMSENYSRLQPLLKQKSALFRELPFDAH